MNARYLVISPCRDEAAFMERTLASVLAQSAPPTRWVIVDDGSTDATPDILARWAAEHDCIRVLRRENRGRRYLGPGVIDAFYEGLATEDLDQFDFVCKLDMDLDLPEGYFEALIKLAEDDPRLGTLSGRPWFIDPRSGKRVEEQIGRHTSVGPTKFLRTACFKQIGGFERRQMWDGIDCYRARMLGWKAGSFDGPSLAFEHLRPMGSSDRSVLRGRARHGRGQWELGASPVFICASAVYRITEKPAVIGSLAMLAGYFNAMLRLRARHPDRELRAFIRRSQRMMMRYGTAEATRRIEADLADRFDPQRQAAPLPIDPRAAPA